MKKSEGDDNVDVKDLDEEKEKYSEKQDSKITVMDEENAKDLDEENIEIIENKDIKITNTGEENTKE